MTDPVFHALVEAARQSEPVALGIICKSRGSSPQKTGAKAVFYSDGRICGTLGGGCLEAEIQQRAIQSLRSLQPSIFELLLDHDFGWDDGLICGGQIQGLILPNAQSVGEGFWGDLANRKIRLNWGVGKDFGLSRVDASPSAREWLYQETVRPPCALWIAGAGHIARAVAPLAAQLDFAVTVLDDRPALANARFFPPEIILKADVWEKLMHFPLPNTPCFGLIVTRGHRHDALVLRHWIKRPFAFLGMIGSGRKARTILEHFVEEKIASPEEMSQVACPVGVSIHAQSVMEIAISIVAQYIERRAECMQNERHRPQAQTS